MRVLLWFVWKALIGKRGENQWRVSTRRMIFYRLKAAVCLLLNIEPAKVTWNDPYIYEDMIYVTYTDGGVSHNGDIKPTTYWSEAIVVGPGIFRNWWACVYQDSSD